VSCRYLQGLPHRGHQPANRDTLAIRPHDHKQQRAINAGFNEPLGEPDRRVLAARTHGFLPTGGQSSSKRAFSNR
jgi:hypothetical protein